MKRNLIVLSSASMSIVLLGLIFSTLILSAQPTPPPHPDGPDTSMSTEEYEAMIAPGLTQQAIIMGRDLRDYAIAYLVSEDSIDDPIFPAENIAKHTTAQIFHDWETFAEAGSKIPFEIVIVHQTGLDFIDRDWAAQAFRDDVVFIGLNVYMADYGELLNSECLKGKVDDDEQRKSISKNWIITLGLSMRDRNAPERDTLVENLLQYCGDGSQNVTFAVTQTPITPKMLRRASTAENIAFWLPALIERFELYKGKENNDE